MGTVQVEDLDDLEAKLSARIERLEEAAGIITPTARRFRPISVGYVVDPTPRPWWRWQLLRFAHSLRWPRLAAWAAEGLVLPHQDTN